MTGRAVCHVMIGYFQDGVKFLLVVSLHQLKTQDKEFILIDEFDKKTAY